MQPIPAWAEAILEQYASGIAVSQIDERLALTPEQRLDRLQRFVAFLDEFDPRDKRP